MFKSTVSAAASTIIATSRNKMQVLKLIVSELHEEEIRRGFASLFGHYFSSRAWCVTVQDFVSQKRNTTAQIQMPISDI